MTVLVAILIGYLLGSIPIAGIVASRHGVDLWRTGSGNPGARNALDQLGARRAWPAFIGDGAKASLAGLIGRSLGGWWVGWAAIAAAMIGHALPIFARGRGGKSVMAFVGGAFVLSPVAALAGLAVAAVLTVARRPSAGALIGVGVFPVVELITDPVTHVQGTGILMTFIGLLFLLGRHRPDRATDARAEPPTG